MKYYRYPNRILMSSATISGKSDIRGYTVEDIGGQSAASGAGEDTRRLKETG